MYYRFLGKNHLPFPYVHRICIFFFFSKAETGKYTVSLFLFSLLPIAKERFRFFVLRKFYLLFECASILCTTFYIHTRLLDKSYQKYREGEEERARKKEDDDEEGECSPSLHIKRIIQPHFFFSRFY